LIIDVRCSVFTLCKLDFPKFKLMRASASQHISCDHATFPILVMLMSQIWHVMTKALVFNPS
jgi:hypothetical protein